MPDRQNICLPMDRPFKSSNCTFKCSPICLGVREFVKPKGLISKKRVRVLSNSKFSAIFSHVETSLARMIESI